MSPLIAAPNAVGQCDAQGSLTSSPRKLIHPPRLLTSVADLTTAMDGYDGWNDTPNLYLDQGRRRATRQDQNTEDKDNRPYSPLGAYPDAFKGGT
jgi:hypothetical protein